MDIAIPQRKRRSTKRYVAIALPIAGILIGLRYLLFLGHAEFSIDRDSLMFSEVKRGRYTVSVRGTGVLVPDNIQWISAKVEGTVVKRAVEAGNVVETGDLIVELTNPRLLQQLAEAQWELEATEAEFRAAKVAQEAALAAQESRALNAKLDYESALLEFNAHAELIATHAVSELDYDRTRLARDQMKQLWLASEHQLEKMRESYVAQVNAQTARLNKTRKSVEIIQKQVDDLQVEATMNSIVLEMPLEAGQRVSMGDNVAKLAEQGSLIAKLQVPEIQIGSVATAQRVMVDTHNSMVDGMVSRIDPAVINGSVEVDVVFTEPLPDDARPDLSVDGEIIVSEISDTLYVGRPLFAQSRSASSLYKLSEDGQFVERVDVRLGYGSVNQIQIVDGLQVGDRIVISDPTRLETYERIRLN